MTTLLILALTFSVAALLLVLWAFVRIGDAMEDTNVLAGRVEAMRDRVLR